MGNSSSGPTETTEQSQVKELEASVSSSGSLTIVRKAFENLAGTNKESISAKSLEQCLHCNFEKLEGKNDVICAELSALLQELAPQIVLAYFLPETGEIDWVSFLKGYDKCFKSVPASVSLEFLFGIFHDLRKKAKVSAKSKIKEDKHVDAKQFKKDDIYPFLWFCWLLEHTVLNPNATSVELPEIKHLVNSALLSCLGSNIEVQQLVDYDDICSSDSVITAENLFSWILNAIPGVSQSFMKYFKGAFQRAALNRMDTGPGTPNKEKCSSSLEVPQPGLLTHGVAWALSVSSRVSLGGNASLEALWCSSHSEIVPDLIYRSSKHGKGLNRFWSHIEGYNGPLLILVHGNVKQEESGGPSCSELVIGALTGQGLENKDTFYGNLGVLYAIKPMFQPFLPMGRDRNFVYSHFQAVGRLYEAYPKPFGLAFGGNQGNERIFIDEDFSSVTLRHHALDKTYQSGTFFPGQPYLPVKASIVEVEAWGLGGETAGQGQARFRKREQIFTEQRRKVDLKTFANWEDSPEKMMMDLMSNPYKVEREDR